ncbi:hypothetical protein K4K49_000387 [Colletotrichum sp. SAR 10_70]|nr:hypothetical protein K4K50_002439 [Colletotrichum sp. SAR 10_71]KAI8185443.1 hypothetical protein K4K49_000387 [Colletotrichum sp. SAR 10_70]KAI8206919.1 hypothetical protein K4K52_002774 [Colletotrichum sp. SAR 10_76]KAI8218073.1 hypothetical protein K4K54_010839 [Colletotrichum sp. SAR 10_86]KAJ4996246.1 hypothetical protein K4K48_008796 [Colletotrichum sp. SAR 10_66]
MSSGFLKDGKELWSKATSGVVEQLVRERDKAFVRTSGTIPKRDDIVDDIARASASGIGFLSEAAHYRRDRKRPEASQEHSRSPELGQESHCERVHAAIWDLDEVEVGSGTELNFNTGNTKDGGSKPVKESTDLATAFLNRHPLKSDDSTGTKSGITMPVVLPQRRPKTRVRGFVRAYAPVLANAGIDEEAFLDFIDTLNKSLIPNPYLYAINLAGLADIITPDPALTAFGILLGIAVEGVMEGQSRFKSNKFLNRMNADFFRPRGLMCFVATWRPDDISGKVPVDFECKTAGESPSVEFSKGDKVSPEASSSENERLDRIKKLLGERLKSHDHILDWSEPAPLLFPAASELVLAQGRDGQKKKNGLDRAEIWLDDYMDKRAQIEWINENPELSAAKALPKAEFKSRYADPTHPAASGDVVALVTGGRWQYKRKQTVSEGNVELDATQNKNKIEDEKQIKISDAENGTSESTTESGAHFQPQLKQEQHDVDESKESTENNGIIFIGPLTLKDMQKEEKKRRKEVEKAAEIEKKGREEQAKKKKKEEKKVRDEEKRMRLENEKALEKKKKVEDKRLKKAAEEEKMAGPAETVDGMIKSLFQKDVLYLLIVNLPSQQKNHDVAVEDTSAV